MKSIRRKISDWLGITNPAVLMQGLGVRHAAESNLPRVDKTTPLVVGAVSHTREERPPNDSIPPVIQRSEKKMTERKPLSISVDMNTDILQLKLRAITKHTEALANELDAIDSNDCTPLSQKQIDFIHGMLKRNEKGATICSCDIKRVLDLSGDDDLPTRLEGSD